MKFEEKYARDSEKSDPKHKDKKIISDDAYVIGEQLDKLVDKIEHARMNL